jgi:D-alanyl-D-alanine carboxypeptidase/D-alanyl-D-alanine-endopeptidase (penicillin-binding protein 4)
MQKKSLLSLILLLLSLTVSLAQIQKSASLVALETEINALKKDPALLHASWSICVYDISKGSVITEYNSKLSLMPASVQKIITTTSALAILGSDYRFTTSVEYTGSIDPQTGVLKGNLFLHGGGDPTLGSKRFGAKTNADSVFTGFARALVKAGIKTIDGCLIGDEDIFDDRIPRSWSYEDVGNYYAANISGLSIYENMYRLYFDAGNAIGDSARLVDIEPDLPQMSFVNLVTTAYSGSGDQVFIMGSPYTNFRILDGTVPLGRKRFDVDGALPDPAMTAVSRFSQILNSYGITIKQGYTTSRAERWKGPAGIQDTASRLAVATYNSPPLSDIIYYTNLKSVNMFAENILKMIGYKKSGTGSTQKGIEAVMQYWSSKGVDLAGLDLYDGSGLSRKNNLSTLQLCKILSTAFSESWYSAFDASLPVAGKSGGMNSMLRGTPAEGKLRAKTGTMDGVRSFAGYANGAAGQDIAFAIITNNFTVKGTEIRKKCEHLMELISALTP